MNYRALIYLLLFSGLVLGVACNHQQEETSQTSLGAEEDREMKPLPNQESWESTIIISKDGRRVAKVWAGYLAVYENKNLTMLKDSIHVDFYDREGQHNSVLTAREGEVDNQTENLKAIGNVVVVSDSGIVLETEELIWDNQKQKIVSEVPVKFTTETDTLLGDSFVSDPDLANYEIRNARGYSQRAVPVAKPDGS